MSNIMELIDDLVDWAVAKGDHPTTVEARAAVVEAVEKLEIEAECFRFWVHEAWHSPVDICKLLSKCETKEDYIAAIVPVIQARKAAVIKAMEATNGQGN